MKTNFVDYSVRENLTFLILTKNFFFESYQNLKFFCYKSMSPLLQSPVVQIYTFFRRIHIVNTAQCAAVDIRSVKI